MEKSKKSYRPTMESYAPGDGNDVVWDRGDRARKEVATRGKKINDLRAIGEIVKPVEDYEIDWIQSTLAMMNGQCVQSHLWLNGEFMWLSADKWKHVATTESLYEPLTKEVLQRLGYKKLLISKHYNRFAGGRLTVGYTPKKAEVEALWRVYIP